MKNKLLFTISLLAGLSAITTVNAMTISSDDVEASTYVIGSHMFTREANDLYDGRLTTKHIMLASKTIYGDKLDNMIIYYKNANSVWVDALTGEPVEVDEKLEIYYINMVGSLDAPTLYNGMGTELIQKTAFLSIRGEGAYAETIENIAGYEVYLSTTDGYELVNTVEKENETIEDTKVVVDIGEKKSYVARVYEYDKDGNKIYSAYSEELVIDNSTVAAPTIYIGAGSKLIRVIALLNIGYEGAYADQSFARISGYEVYLKNGNEYKLVSTIEKSNDTLEEAEVTVDIGEKNTYVARAFAYNLDGEKVYSDYSEEETIDNSTVETPTLYNGMGTELVQKTAFLSIVAEGAYAESIVGISGYEVYLKTADSYELVTSIEVKDETLDPAKVVVDIGEKNTYVAKAFAYNLDGEKVYSAYSEELVIDNTTVAAPTIYIGAGSKLIRVIALLNIGYEGAYADQSFARISGYEVYLKNGSEYKLVSTIEKSNDTLEEAEVTVDIGEKNTYVARAFAYNLDGEKVYSAYSAEETIDNSTVAAPTLYNGMGGQGEDGTLKATLNIAAEGAYVDSTDQIDGFELYEKTTDNKYVLVEDVVGSGNVDITLPANTTKIYVAKAYAYNLNNEKVYSAYSEELVVSSS